MQNIKNRLLNSSTQEVPSIINNNKHKGWRHFNDIVLIHSSLKSFGYVIGGPISAINAAKEAVTESGTVVFPTLVQNDFANAYKNWDIRNSPPMLVLFRNIPSASG